MRWHFVTKPAKVCPYGGGVVLTGADDRETNFDYCSTQTYKGLPGL